MVVAANYPENPDRSNFLVTTQESRFEYGMLGRAVQLEEVVSLLGGEMNSNAKYSFENEIVMNGGLGYPIIVVYGYNSTGKSTCVRLALQHTAPATYSAFVDCRTVYSSRQVFTDILRQVWMMLLFSYRIIIR
jgi:hypothetical protein